jgi:hypothetical protein
MSKNKEDHITDLKETFTNLREAQLKLNPEKFIFGISKGKCSDTSSVPKVARQTQTRPKQ